MAVTPRAQRLKERIVHKGPTGGEYQPGVGACIERARLWTEAYKEAGGEPEVIRRAKALAGVLDNMTIFIKDGELIVGYTASRPHLMPVHPECSYSINKMTLEEPYLAEELKGEFREIADYWKSKTLQARVEQLLTEEEKQLTWANTSIQVTNYIDGVSVAVPDFAFVFQHGLQGIVTVLGEQLAKVEQKIYGGPTPAAEELRQLMARTHQYRAMIIACEAAMRWARRYSELAAAAAALESDPQKRRDLEEVARVCARVPIEPVEHFGEAVQALWFVQLIYYGIERLSTGASFRMDQLLWPYYERDVLAEKRLTREQAQEIIELIRIKFAELGRMGIKFGREIIQGAGEVMAITVGGVRRDGSDACNELTEVVLDATTSIRTNQPQLVLRYHPRIPRKVLLKALECVRAGMGMPAFRNDEVDISALLRFGNTLEDARDWAVIGCMAPGPIGRKGARTRNAWFLILAKCLELALHDGYDSWWSKVQLGPNTGDAGTFETFEQVWEAFRRQLHYAVQTANRVRLITRLAEAEFFPQPFLSSTFAGCIERGVDGIAWDEIPNPYVDVAGCIDTADSLAALKKLVFEEKRFSMREVTVALQANWQGFEQMRRLFINDAPKFGNDDDYADNMAKRVMEALADEMNLVKDFAGASPQAIPQSLTVFWSHGLRTGALPNGRLGGEVLADGGVSPHLGYDKKGPTAVLNSVAKIDHRSFKGCLLNQRLTPASIMGDKGAELFLNYLRTWYELGIDHVQFNVADIAVLRAAQQEPEKYPDLIVRIAGYCAYFTQLNRQTQEAVIARTEQTLGSAS